jgi:hypothetical protein
MELLVFARDPETATSLCRNLDAVGFTSDPVTTLADAQAAFLQRGGHALLIITPDVPTGRARRLIETLHGVDEKLSTIVFGEETLRGESFPHLHRIKSFHPSSRAGVGAIQKIACNLSPA